MLTDKQDYDEIYQKYKNLVMKAAYKYSGNYDIAEDITQSTFLQLYMYIDELKDDEQTSLHEEIFAALYKHNPRWYDAIRYVYYLEIPQSAVAERMEISIEVLHSLLYRARKWIRKKFGVEYEEFLEL